MSNLILMKIQIAVRSGNLYIILYLLRQVLQRAKNKSHSSAEVCAVWVISVIISAEDVTWHGPSAVCTQGDSESYEQALIKFFW